MANVGSAYISIYPSLDGFESKLKAALSGIDVSSVGEKMGDKIGDGIGKGIGDMPTPKIPDPDLPDFPTDKPEKYKSKLSALAGVAGGVAAELAGRLFDSVMNLGSEMVEASDSAQKFASTLKFGIKGISDTEIQSLIDSTQKYADDTVYDLADIRNATAQLAANGVDNYAQLAEAAGNLNAVAGGNAETFKSVSMVMSQTAGSGRLMTENWNQLTDAIPGASGALQEAMRSAGAFEGNFREAMENGEISADEFFAAVQQLGMQDVAVDAAKSTSTIEGAMGNLQASVVGIGSQLITDLSPAITGAMNILTAAISGLAPIIDGAVATLGPIFQGIADNIGLVTPVLAGLTAGFVAFKAATMISGAITAVQTALNGMTIAQAASAAAQRLLNAAMSANPIVLVVTLIAGLVTALVTLWNTNEEFRDAVTAAWNAISTTASQVWGTVVNFFTVTVPQAIQDLIDWFSQLPTNIGNFLQSALASVLSWAASVALQAYQAGSQFLSNVSNFFGQLPGNVASFLGNVISNVASWVGQMASNATSAAADFGSNLINGLASIPGQVVSIGRDIIQGIANGITGAAGSVISAIGDAVGGAIDWAKGLLGIASPSKVFRKFGEYTMEGFALGISDEESAPVRALRSAMTTVEDVMEASGVISTTIAAGADGAASSSASAGPSPAQLLARIVELLEMIYQVIPEGMSAKDRARFARKAVAYGI